MRGRVRGGCVGAWDFCLTGAILVSCLAALEAAPQGRKDRFQHGLELFDEAQDHASRHPADRDENARRFRQAALSFVAAWETGGASAEVFANAANSFYFAGDIAEAVLFYRRALAVDPAADRARESLQHLRTALPIRKPAGSAAVSLLRSLFFWHESLSFRMRRLLFTGCFTAAFAFFAVSLWRRPFRLLGSVALVFALVLLASLLVDAFGGSLAHEAVVMVEVQGRRGDALTYSPSHSRPFPPGTEVTVRDVRGTRDASAGPNSRSSRWALVDLLDGSESWIPESAIERVLEKGL